MFKIFKMSFKTLKYSQRFSAGRSFFLSVILSVLAISASGQVRGTISGTVRNATNQAVTGATVSIFRSQDSAAMKFVVSDENGRFSFGGLADGKYLLAATGTGSASGKTSVLEINESAPSVVRDIILSETEKSLAVVTIAAKKQYIERKLDKTVINVEAAISNAGTTAMEVLEKSPGVSVDKDGNISLKGKKGVIVLIDGKQTYMAAQDLATYLQSMPAANLEQIELMPNPSSKYDASGTSGVINLRTKKARQKGFNGTFSSSYGRGRYGRISNNLNLNYRNGKFNVFSSFGANHRKTVQVLGIHREYFNAGGARNAIFDQEARFIKDRGNNNGKVGVDFYATKKTTVGLVVSGYYNPGIHENTNVSYLKDGAGSVNSILNSPSTEKQNWKNLSANFNLRHSFDSTGRDFSFDLDALRYDNRREQQLLSETFTPLWIKQSAEELRSELPSVIDVVSAKADYTHSFKGGTKIESGLKSSFVKTNNAAGFYNVVNGGQTPDNEKSNHFNYRENINAAYVNVSREYKKWNLQGGLRLENTNYQGLQFGNPLHADSAFKRSYTGLFPTMFAGFKLNDKNDLGFSYGRRISRPDYESLNPFIFFIDKYTYESGNPFLKPMFANVIELSHTYKKVFTTTLNCTHSKDMFNEYFEQAGYATIVRENNYGSINDISLSLNAEIKPFTWWTVMPYAEFTYNAVNSQVYGYDLRTTGRGFSFNVNNQFRFKDGWGAELSGFYQSHIRKGQFEISGMGQANTGVSKQVLKGKGSLKLNFNDMFNGNKKKGVIHIQNTDARFTQMRDSRNVNLAVSYRFGKPMKSTARKSGGAGEEQQRIKGN